MHAKDGFSRRKALAAFGTAAIAGAASPLLGRLAPAAAQARPFTWAATGGSWGETLNRLFIKPFADQHKLTVNHSAQLEAVAASKIMASCGNAPFDVSNGPQSDYDLLFRSNCIEAYDLSVVTNLANVFPEARQGDFYAAFSILLFGLCWNTKEAQSPASLKDLLLSKYRGRVGIPAYGWYGMAWLHALNKEFGGTEDDIGPGIAAAAEMVKKNKAVIVENADHGMRLMESGEVVLMPYWNGRTIKLQEANVPAAFATVPGTILLGSGFAIMKGSPFARQAQDLIQLTLDPAKQLEFAKWSKYPPSNKLVKLPSELQAIAIPDGALERTAKLDWQKINQHRSDYLERWNKEVLAS